MTCEQDSSRLQGLDSLWQMEAVRLSGSYRDIQEWQAGIVCRALLKAHNSARIMGHQERESGAQRHQCGLELHRKQKPDPETQIGSLYSCPNTRRLSAGIFPQGLEKGKEQVYA